jgi:hypothetical protein
MIADAEKAKCDMLPTLWMYTSMLPDIAPRLIISEAGAKILFLVFLNSSASF